MRSLILVLVAVLPIAACQTTGAAKPPQPASAAATVVSQGSAAAHDVEPLWEEFTPEAFTRAKAQGRLILVSVQTEWCHWCHVMDEKTWGDPRVAALLRARFVTLRVDADARPDIADRYREWAWPATAVLTPDARAVLHIKGYRAADRVLVAFERIVEDLDAGREIALQQVPPEKPIADANFGALRAQMTAQLDRLYDEKVGGWGGPKKFPLHAPIEHAFLRARRQGQTQWQQRALFTLEQSKNLVDPVWGGVYQYSTYSIWTRPHFEKLAFVQAWSMREYAEGYRVSGDQSLLDVARGVRRYLNEHMRSDDGGYFANQDADVGTRGERAYMLGKDFYALDDAGRRAAGSPFVDRNVYAFHNGVIIAALAELYAAGDDEDALQDAAAALALIERTHSNADGSYRHAADPDELLHLADQRAMAQALLALHEATGERAHRDRLVRLVDTTLLRLSDEQTGALFAHTALAGAVGDFAQREHPLRDNAVFARVLIRLGHLTKDARYRDAAERIVRAFARPAYLKDQRRLVGEYLLALEDLLDTPMHFTVVGGDDDAKALYREALGVYAPGRILELQAPGEKFPDIGQAALYVCSDSFCSPPILDPAKVAAKVPRYLSDG